MTLLTGQTPRKVDPHFTDGLSGFRFALECAMTMTPDMRDELVSALIEFTDESIVPSQYLSDVIADLERCYNVISLRKVRDVSRKSVQLAHRSGELLDAIPGKRAREAHEKILALMKSAQASADEADAAIAALELEATTNPLVKSLIYAPISDDPEDYEWDDDPGWNADVKVISLAEARARLA